MTRRHSQMQHDRIVEKVYHFLLDNRFYEVRADMSGVERPRPVEGNGNGEFVPDVTAQGEKFVLFEVETADSVQDEHTSAEWKCFSEFARQHHAEFYLIVPEGAEQGARRRAEELGVEANILKV